MSTMTEEELVARFLELSEKALSERGLSALITCLEERKPFAADLVNHRIRLEPERIEEILSQERKIFKKLKEERAKVLREIEETARARTASKMYSSKFAIPPMPMFFNKRG